MFKFSPPIYLFLIFSLSFLLRFLGQPSYPACFHRDEVQWAYNAYSLSQTLRDEWGQFLPLYPKFNGEYHVPIVMYLPALFFRFLPASEITFRLPFIILGSLIPILGYYFSRQLKFQTTIPQLFAFMLSVSPWQIMNSRGSGELSILSLFFGLLGFNLLFLFLSTSRLKYLIPSLISFVLTYFSYLGSTLDIPLLLVLLVLLFHRQLPRPKLTYPLLLLVFILPFFLVLTHSNRYHSTSIISKNLEGVTRNPKPLLIASKNILFDFVDNYFDYLNPYYLFRNMGEYSRTNLNHTGSLYLYEFIFVLIGLYTLISCRLPRQTKLFLLFGLLITPIVGALTYNSPDRPNSSRTVYYYFLWQLISAIGLSQLIILISPKLKPIFYPVILGIIFLNLIFVWGSFYRYGNALMAPARGCGYQEVFHYTESVKDQFSMIHFGAVFDTPYIQYLWYSRYSPAIYHHFLQTTPPNNQVALLMQPNPKPWILEKYQFIHDSCPVGTEENHLYVGNFRDCKDRYGIRVRKDPVTSLIYLLTPNDPIKPQQLVAYQEEYKVQSPSGSVVFNLYSYADRYQHPLPNLKTLETFPFYEN